MNGTSSGTTTRRATAADAEAAAAVFTESRRRAALPASVHTEDEDRWFVREVLIAEKDTWVALSGDDIVAIMSLSEGWIDQLYVHPAHAGRGVGSTLVELAKSRYPQGLQLWTFESNAPAQQFYERHGFVAVERTDGSGNEEKAPDIRYSWTAASAN